ncbi:reverse transcriptase [Caerostris darwini]|uniref:Reverse transcriptase n=1 Tax=Caerostris darwini TaxID=1538125 RepID=A0AAV4NZX0_9ARAC|nr:reverse transcriptase [Caerostris darwini]
MNTQISCLNDSTVVLTRRVIILGLLLERRAKSFEKELTILVIKKLTDIIPHKFLDINDVLNSAKLADSNFNIPDQISLLLGVELFYEVLGPEQILAPYPNLLLQNTVFGFVISGRVSQKMKDKMDCETIRKDLNET